jgi:cold-inducible RNA-binding protein
MASKKVFVGSLAWATTDDSLADFFSQCGDVVEAKVVTDRETGRSRGFGFVTFEDEGASGKAVDLDGEELDGRTIHVDFAKERDSR